MSYRKRRCSKIVGFSMTDITGYSYSIQLTMEMMKDRQQIQTERVIEYADGANNLSIVDADADAEGVDKA